MRRVVTAALRFLACVAAYNVALALSAQLLTALRIEAPALPPGADAARLPAYVAAASFLIVGGLLVVSRGLSGPASLRSLALAAIVWVAMGVNTAIEAAIFTVGSGGFFTGLLNLLPALAGGGAIVALFPNPQAPPDARDLLFLKTASPERRTLSLALAVLAFPVIYFVFGMAVAPLVVRYYEEGQMGLVLPPINVLVPVLFLRSVLFLASCIPVILLWQGSRQSLALRLGTLLFVVVGMAPLFIAHWLPWHMRLAHGVEVAADSFVYAAVLAGLFFRRAPARPAAQAPSLAA